MTENLNKEKVGILTESHSSRVKIVHLSRSYNWQRRVWEHVIRVVSQSRREGLHQFWVRPEFTWGDSDETSFRPKILDNLWVPKKLKLRRWRFLKLTSYIRRCCLYLRSRCATSWRIDGFRSFSGWARLDTSGRLDWISSHFSLEQFYKMRENRASEMKIKPRVDCQLSSKSAWLQSTRRNWDFELFV